MRRKITDSPASSFAQVIGGGVALVFGVGWSTVTGPFFAPLGYFGWLICLFGIVNMGVGLFNLSARPEERIGGTEIVDIDDNIYCKHCGKGIPDDSTYCKFCGGQQ